MTPQGAERLERGRELFNSGCYFEAHEVWEQAWLGEKGPVRELFQGLIQVAAGCHKAARRESAKGCVQLLAAGLSRIRAAGAEAPTGLALSEFLREVERSLSLARLWLSGSQAALERESLPTLRSLDSG